jgi:hypothetical protein
MRASALLSSGVCALLVAAAVMYLTQQDQAPAGTVALPPLSSLKPTAFSAAGRTHYYQMPAGGARGLVVWLPGCIRTAMGFWPAGSAPGFLGFPEDVSHTRQILGRGYAILVLTAADTRMNCWSTGSDSAAVVESVSAFVAAKALAGKPVYMMGASSGAGLMIRVQTAMRVKVAGMVAEVNTRNPPPNGSPPCVWVCLQRDTRSQDEARQLVAALRARGTPAAAVTAPTRAITPTYFQERVPGLTAAQSQELAAALQKLGQIDARGNLTRDPKTSGAVPKLRGMLSWKPILDLHDSAIWQALLVAWAMHEHVSDYTTAALMWFEAGGKADFRALAAAYAVTKPAL